MCRDLISAWVPRDVAVGVETTVGPLVLVLIMVEGERAWLMMMTGQRRCEDKIHRVERSRLMSTGRKGKELQKDAGVR